MATTLAKPQARRSRHSAWIYQQPCDKRRYGEEATIYVGWYDEQGKRRSRSCGFGGAALARAHQVKDEIDYMLLLNARVEKDIVYQKRMTQAAEFYKMANVPEPTDILSALPLSGVRVSGIYFVWVDWERPHRKVAYVGQSTDIAKRIDDGGSHHHAIRQGDGLSWLGFPVSELDFAECFYIWLCRPHRNFGGRNDIAARAESDGKVDQQGEVK